MKSNLASGLILFSLMLTGNLSISPEKSLAQSVNIPCRDALLNAASTIENGRNVRVANLRSYELSSNYRNYPRESPVAVLYVLEGRATEDILASGQFMTILANRITEACPFIGLVEFGLNQSSWREAFGKVNGQMTYFRCIPPGLSQPPQWGEQVCV